jgi:predicted dehydrogenase
MSPVTIALVGAGARGLLSYATYAEEHPDEMRVVAVAEPREWFRNEAVKRHSIQSQNVFSDWRELIKQPKMADAVIVATQDQDHVEPAVALMNLGYDVLLEKPMATTEEGCRKIIEAQRKNNVILAVCHVLRYSPYFRKIREIVQSGVLGQIVSMRHMEQVGYWHDAHSYVRGNWRKESESSPMILAKSCHDMDIMTFMLGRRCEKIASFGRLSHFRPENRPKDATDRCVTCPLAESKCPYSATRYYLSELKEEGKASWPVDVITNEYTKAGILEALSTGPYGRCVYSCDNDVVDHQVLSMEFEGGITATFSMIAFTEECDRKTEIFGSHGELVADAKTIVVKNFVTKTSETFQPLDSSREAHAGHMGGDARLVKEFVLAVKTRSPESLVSGPQISYESHIMAFAAEKSRKLGTIESI